MIKNNLVLDVPPGIGLLGMGFEAEGYVVVNGPDLLWGKDMIGWHPVKGAFEGVIGGPPCKGESLLAHLNGDPSISLAGEFDRIINEAQPDWWVMEAVRPHLELAGVYIMVLSPRWLGEKQSRVRYFHSNLNLEGLIDVSLFENPVYKYAVLAAHGGKRGTIERRIATYSWPEMLELQGLPADFDLPFFTRVKAREAVGNGVPLCMGRAVAKAVRRACMLTSETPEFIKPLRVK